jgi:hypothetical protein
VTRDQKPQYPCPCCGYLEFAEAPGSYEICGVCGWEDDLVQLRDPHYRGGANSPSLVQAQQEFLSTGLFEPKPGVHERDSGWRPFDADRDNLELASVEGDWTKPWPEDPTALYWWRQTYWQRKTEE